MLIACPFCGEREVAEFEFRLSIAPWGVDAAEQLYFRSAEPARSIEHWQHVRGCRMWLELHRDLRSGAILETRTDLSALPSESPR
ncbi:MAG TPA: sarcosine oxidase subunit delta [Steroidobacteraceae bacterium]|nr:sarcosine oxidase subunit delta [Steroidobacteraceae bacterium]